jgi:hypothetical protein
LNCVEDLHRRDESAYIHNEGRGSIFSTVFTVLTGCGSAMRTTIENHGSATLDCRGLCGDAMYDGSISPAATIEWTPSANNCSIDVRGDSAGRRLTIRQECRHGSGCSIGVLVSNRGRSEIAGTGQIEVVGDLTTVVSRSSPAKENSGG